MRPDKTHFRTMIQTKKDTFRTSKNVLYILIFLMGLQQFITHVNCEVSEKSKHLTGTNTSLSPVWSFFTDPTRREHLVAISAVLLRNVSRDHEELRNILLQPDMGYRTGIFHVPVCTHFKTGQSLPQCSMDEVYLFFNGSLFPPWFQESEIKVTKTPLTNLGTGISKQGCGPVKIFMSPCGNINSIYETGRYRRELECEWIIQVRSSFAINLTFTHVDLVFGGPECKDDYIKVYEGQGMNKTLLGVYCGRRMPFSILSTENIVTIHLRSGRQDTGSGFLSQYEALKKGEFVMLRKPTLIRNESGTISSKDSLVTALTPSLKVYLWHIRTTLGKRVQFNATVNSFSFATLDVFDGPNLDARWKLDLKQQPTPMCFESNGPSLTIRFQTSKGSNASLWGFFSSQSILMGRLQDLSQNTTVGCEGIPYQKLQTGSKTNIQFYKLPYNTTNQCSWRISAEKGKFIQMTIKHFNFNGSNINECEMEGVTFYDGNSTDSFPIGPFCNIFGHRAFLLRKKRIELLKRESEETRLISSSNEILIYAYHYTNTLHPGDILLVEIEIETTDCRGISDWSTIGTLTWLAPQITELDPKTTKIELYPQENICFALQWLPLEKPTDHIWNVYVHSVRSYTRLTSEVKGYSYLINCLTYVTMTTNLKYHHLQYVMECPWPMIGFVHLFTNKEVSSECKDITQRDGKASMVYKPAICGNIIVTEPHDIRLTLMAPLTNINDHYYCFRVTCHGFDPCMAVQMTVSMTDYDYVYEEDGMQPRWINHPNLDIYDQIPFFWRSWWSYKVVVQIKPISPYISILIGYSLTKYNTPSPAVIAENLTCPNSSYYYDNHCYLFVGDKTKAKDDPLTWSQANRHCQEVGGHLLSIHSEEELSYIRYMLNRKWKEVVLDSLKIVYIGLQSTKDGLQWVDGRLATVQDWYIPQFAAKQPLPYTTFGKDIKFVSTNTIEPTTDSSTRCTAMVIISNSFSTNWIKIPCEYPYVGQSHICKIPISTRKTENRDILNSSKSQVEASEERTCPNGWTKIERLCFRLETSTFDINKQFSCKSGINLCKELGGEIANINDMNFSLLKQYLKIWRHELEYGSIWISYKNASETVCGVIEGKILDVNCHKKDWVLRDSPAKHSLNVLCQTNMISRTLMCGDNQFTCSDGECILSDHVCDGIPDCNDGYDEVNCTCSSSSYKCKTGLCIPLSKYCDFHFDCPDHSDEESCSYPKCDSTQYRCDNGQCIATSLYCNFIQDCLDGSDETNCESTCNGFLCYSGLCIASTQVNDLVADCPGQSQEDEALPTSVKLKRGIWNEGWVKRVNYKPFCINSTGDSVRCHVDRIPCFSRSSSCVFDHDEYGNMASCRDGIHLRHCKTFECPGMFKCTNSYCIPNRKVCDGIQDCPQNDDEISCEFHKCPGKFHCKGETYCIDQAEVCDGIVHCKKYQDDEKLCNLLTCPAGCNCNGQVVDCHYYISSTLPELPKSIRGLFLTNSGLKLGSITFKGLSLLGVLDLSNNNIGSIPNNTFSDQENLFELNLSYNKLRMLNRGMFHGLKTLRTLHLRKNPIESVGAYAFDGLSLISLLNLSNLAITKIEDDSFSYSNNITMLDVSHNRMMSLTQNTFKGLNRLKSLDISGNEIINLHDASFTKLAIDNLQTDGFRFCCYAKHVDNCSPKGDEFSSCEDLMANPTLQITIWLLGVLAFVGNSVVIIWRCIKEYNKVPSMIIIHLGISDLLMGVYLLIIASADVMYRGKYILHADTWKSSVLCKFAGFISMLSSEMSVYCLVLITIDRLIGIVFALKIKRIGMKLVLILLVAGWLIFGVLSVLPIVDISYFGNDYIQNGICLLFNFTHGKTNGWEYATTIFLCFNLAAFIFIFIGYLIIFMTIRSTHEAAGRKDSSEAALARKFALVVASDFLCWMPLILTGIISLGGGKIPPQVSAWMAVFILPINSALNPILYSLSAYLQDRKRQKKKSAHAQSSRSKFSTSGSTKITSVDSNNGKL